MILKKYTKKYMMEPLLRLKLSVISRRCLKVSNTVSDLRIQLDISALISERQQTGKTSLDAKKICEVFSKFQPYEFQVN